MKQFPNSVVWVLLIILLGFSFLTIYLHIARNDRVTAKDVSNIIATYTDELKAYKPQNGVDGHTPVKNVDYFDGLNGKNATDDQVKQAVDEWFKKNPPQVIVVKGDNGEDGANGRDGVDGVTPEIQCNQSKNRWEVKYHPEDSWQLLNGEKVKCMIGE